MAVHKRTTLAEKKRIMPGRRFGRLVVSGYAHTQKGNHYWLCKCDCGGGVNVSTTNLMNGHVASCGCFKSELNTTHDMTGTRVYKAWINMKSRCENPAATSYEYYGGRGVSVCERWQKFEAFFDDMGHPPSPAHSLDRIDPDGNYEPDNCRWATSTEQVRNRRNNVILTFDGHTRCLSEWSHVTGIPYRTLLNRVRRNWKAERVLATRPTS